MLPSTVLLLLLPLLPLLPLLRRCCCRCSVVVDVAAFGEHAFTTATTLHDGKEFEVSGRFLQLNLGAGAQVELDLCMELHANTDPSYLRPWDVEGQAVPPQQQSRRAIATASAKM